MPALRVRGNGTVVRILIEAAAGGHDWALATLGRLAPQVVRPAIAGSDLPRLAPVLLLSAAANWPASEDRVVELAFLQSRISDCPHGPDSAAVPRVPCPIRKRFWFRRFGFGEVHPAQYSSPKRRDDGREPQLWYRPPGVASWYI